jgi:multicomponent Na+:H+ antiporter subunit D
MFPLHLWLPNAYTYAPSVITVFLSATATKVAVYVMLRFVFTVFSDSFAQQTPTGDMFLLLGIAGVIFASVYAVYQRDAKRLLAYSSVAQVAYMVLGIAFGSAMGLIATLVHIFNHALMKGALFMAVGALVYRVGSSRLDKLDGLGRRMPWTFAAFFIAALSLIGVPGTAGFISKWYFVLAALEQQHWLVAVVILVGSLIAVIYSWKLVEVLFFRATTQPNSAVKEAPLSLLIPMWVLVIANVYFGLNTQLTVGVAETAVRVLRTGQQ